MNTLQDALLEHTRIREGAPLLISPETARIRTYAATLHAAHSLVAQFDALGVPPGGHVGFFLGNGLAASTLFLGAMCTGRVIVPFNLLSKGVALAQTIAHSEVTLIYTQPDLRATVDEACALLNENQRSKITIREIDPDSTRFSDHGTAKLPGVSEDAPALLMYTSGTTGTPKGALLTHANLMHVGKSVSSWHGLTANDRVLSSLPMYHINGQCIATIAPFVSGGSIVAPHKFSTSAWWDWVRAWNPTWLNVVPTIIAYLLNDAQNEVESVQPEFGDRRVKPFRAKPSIHGNVFSRRKTDFSSVRFARSASAPLPPEHHRAFERRFAIGVIEAMGMTECASMVFCNPQDPGVRKVGTPGLPCGVQAKVIDAEGKELSNHEPGELCLRGPNVMKTYFNAPEQTQAAFTADGWLRTGDIGHRDNDGFYFVTGRIKELIIKGGENIAPREIDEALLAHPSVLEAAAYALPDTDYGQDVAAAVVLKTSIERSEANDTAMIAELREHCEHAIGKFKSPRHIQFVAELPKGPSGKVQRLKLAPAA
jgi:acyl-CoA synthetase (AMP-forming)/AMP-acid ligase II